MTNKERNHHVEQTRFIVHRQQTGSVESSTGKECVETKGLYNDRTQQFLCKANGIDGVNSTRLSLHASRVMKEGECSQRSVLPTLRSNKGHHLG